MKITIYRHLRGYCLISETVDPSRVLGENFPAAAVCRETALDDLVRVGLADTANLIVSRMYLDLPADLGDQILESLNSRQTATVG